MPFWYRIFGRSSAAVPQAAVRDCLRDIDAKAVAEFDSAETDWLKATLTLGNGSVLHLERFLATEEGIRAELNTWAAYLETCEYNSNSVPLMEQMVQTSQLFTLRCPIDSADDALVEELCRGLSRFLARATDGVYQADDQGFFSADGILILPEPQA